MKLWFNECISYQLRHIFPHDSWSLIDTFSHSQPSICKAIRSDNYISSRSHEFSLVLTGSAFFQSWALGSLQHLLVDSGTYWTLQLSNSIFSLAQISLCIDSRSGKKYFVLSHWSSFEEIWFLGFWETRSAHAQSTMPLSFSLKSGISFQPKSLQALRN